MTTGREDGCGRRWSTNSSARLPSYFIKTPAHLRRRYTIKVYSKQTRTQPMFILIFRDKITQTTTRSHSSYSSAHNLINHRTSKSKLMNILIAYLFQKCIRSLTGYELVRIKIQCNSIRSDKLMAVKCSHKT